MAITKYDDVVKALTTTGKLQNIWFFKGGSTVESSAPSSSFFTEGLPSIGAAPSTNRVCTKDTAGAIFVGNPTGGEKAYLLGGSIQINSANNVFAILCDRLVDTTGLSGTVATPQTTNLPTPTLTRYTDGKGVLIGLQCWTATGSTTANVTCSYTNQDGTSGRTSVSVVFWTGGYGGGTIAPTAGQIQILPFQAGDYGCRSVESVTLSTSTLTAGNFGVVLLKPLTIFNLGQATTLGYNYDLTLYGGLEEKIDETCYDIIYSANTTTPKIFGKLDVLYA